MTLKPAISIWLPSGAKLEVFGIEARGLMPGFGGSRSGLLVGKTASIVTRELRNGCQMDTEFGLNSDGLWTRIAFWLTQPGAQFETQRKAEE